MLKNLYAGLSNVGKVRTSNEDSLGLFPDQNLFLVADGMGGHAAGEVASRLAVDTVQHTFVSPPEDTAPAQPGERLRKAIEVANLKIYEMGKKKAELAGMGTTIVSAHLSEDTAYIGHVGDSRAYLIRLSEISQITKDHSLVNEYLKRGMMGPDEVDTHPLKHVLSRALGTAPHVEVDILPLPLQPGDILLLCSDGLTNTVPAQTIFKTIQQHEGSLDKACQALIDEANAKGGIDNITVVIVQCLNNKRGPG